MCADCKKYKGTVEMIRAVPDPRGPEMGGWMYETKMVCKRCAKKYEEDEYTKWD